MKYQPWDALHNRERFLSLYLDFEGNTREI